MQVSTARYLKALQEINIALTTGLQFSISFLENFARLIEEQRRSLINQLKTRPELGGLGRLIDRQEKKWK